MKKLKSFPALILVLIMLAGVCPAAQAEVMTLGDVAQYEECDLMKFRNFGKKSVLELKSLLESQGLHLGMDVNAVITKHMALMMIQAEDEY